MRLLVEYLEVRYHEFRGCTDGLSVPARLADRKCHGDESLHRSCQCLSCANACVHEDMTLPTERTSSNSLSRVLMLTHLVTSSRIFTAWSTKLRSSNSTATLWKERSLGVCENEPRPSKCQQFLVPSRLYAILSCCVRGSTTRATVRWLRQGATGGVVLSRLSSRISSDPAFVASGILGDMFVDASKKSMAGDKPAIKSY
jgi:hypothetical protein